MKQHIFFIFILITCGKTYSAPNGNSFVVSSTEPSNENGKENVFDNPPINPIIYEMDITTNISNRFAKTLVVSKVKNSDKSAKEITFTVVLPEKAFISEFVMEIGGKSYKAYVKEKEEAKNIYDKAVASGQSAAHVSVSARDSDRFSVSVNIEPESKAVFLLTYEELLQRKNDQYELVLNIHPGQIVKQLSVEVHINESRPLKFVKTPSLRSGNEISKNEDKLDPSSDIQIVNSTATIRFNPDAEKQKQFGIDLGTKESDGISGQFVVQYDVERDPQGGEVLLEDGYFVHFFAPSDLEPLLKHVVFVLDTSGSMGGRKILQLKDAMKSILSEIKKGDMINIVEFNNDVKVWDINNKNTTIVSQLTNYEEPLSQLSEFNLPIPTLVDGDVEISKAKKVIEDLYASGGTNIIGGLDTALYLVKVGRERNSNKADQNYQPMIIFLTDGEPNIGISSTDQIVKIVTQLNSKNNNVPIFSLSFGYGADKKFLRQLSLKNLGFSRHIYEASDASLQLQEFYKQISSPLLSNIKFKYESEVKEVTKVGFPVFFRGSELVVAGKYEEPHSFPTRITCWGPVGPITLRPVIKTPVTSLEGLWAYLTVKQTLEERDSVENKTDLTKKALDLALKYSFVTDVTSLVVVKPNDTNTVNTEEATEGNNNNNYRSSFARSSHIFGSSFSSPIARFSGRADLASFNPSYGALAFPRSSAPGIYRFRSNALLYDHDSDSIRHKIKLHPSTTVKPTLKSILPWLKTALNANGTLTISQTDYELGENSSFPATTECPTTPLNNTDTGICTLLKDCPEVYSYLTDFQVYQQFFCPVNNLYAGICCPKKANFN